MAREPFHVSWRGRIEQRKVEICYVAGLSPFFKREIVEGLGDLL
jgi:hypothetical protein